MTEIFEFLINELCWKHSQLLGRWISIEFIQIELIKSAFLSTGQSAVSIWRWYKYNRKKWQRHTHLLSDSAILKNEHAKEKRREFAYEIR